ncbi:MAG: hypothetical protein Ct9H300mP6_04880 [Gammaproteobacteria bacterium]|nr:MAG: hypothetical protein Ct9H300mP6_04880 [Gammaproteobacteria bacterium]
MYVCGITAYSFPHIGNARGPVVFDVLARVLRRQYKLTYVRNITDLDDKIYDAAQKEESKFPKLLSGIQKFIKRICQHWVLKNRI